MSVYTVRRRFLDVVVEGRGRVSKSAYAGLVASAREGGVSPAERVALTDPANDFARSRILKSHGIRLEDIRLDAGAWKIAEALAHEFSLAVLFPRLPNARPGGTAPPPPPAHSPTLKAALDKGRPLGPPESWQLQTSGADLHFVSRAGHDSFAAVVLDLPVWKDPAPRDLAAESAGKLAHVHDAEALQKFIHEVVKHEHAWFDAEGVSARSKNERYGIQELRRAAFFGALAKLAVQAPSLLRREREALVCGRDYDMDVGSHKNYWPYWNNYRGFLDKVLAQTAPGSDEALCIQNRIDDILDRKTVFTEDREVDERNFEVSVKAALVHRPAYSDGLGRRVSLSKDSSPLAPRYEVLTVKSSADPKWAQKSVFRDGAELVCEGKPLPHELAGQLEAQAVGREELGLRPLLHGEKARKGIAFDWTHDGEIDLSPVEIGWWGHCHNESPLNAMGIDPKTPVELYRADPAIPADKRLQKYSSDDIWDVAGALAADHEQGWAVKGAYRMQATEVEREVFVGNRNDGGHWLLVEPAGGRRVRIDAEITELWHKSDPKKKYATVAERFRRDLPAADGTFAANPEWIDAGARDEDEITIDAKGRKLAFTATWVTLTHDGSRVEKKEHITLDPASAKPVKIAEEIQGDKLVEHWYEAKGGTYFQVVQEVMPARRELSRTAPVQTTRVSASQETTYDSVIEIHDFVMQDPGLPFVFDTSSGMSVWNYPVNRVRVDRLREVEKDGFTFTTYKLDYETMGGPSNKASYIIKRDAKGNPERALALDPMPDFAFRQEHWVCAPAAADAHRRVAINVQALQAGYLTDKSGEKIVPELWRRQATLLYASLSGDRWLFETREGDLYGFRDQASFDAAVAADGR